MSSSVKLKNIEIRSFRGIKQLDIDFNKKSLVLVGENGSGKSSIVNAFEYLFTGKVESLSGKQAINHNQSIIHLGDDKNDLMVEAKFGKSSITRTMDDFTCPDDLKCAVMDFKNGSFLLNRKKLLSFIESTPSKRYESITTLIGFDDLDEIEKTLKKTMKKFDGKFKSKTAEVSKKTSTLTMLLNCRDDEIYGKINEILSKHGLDNIHEVTNLRKFIKNFPVSDFNKSDEISDLISLLDIDISSLKDEFESLLSEYTSSTLYELKSTSTLIDILNKSSEYLEKEKPDKCPVCRKNIESTQVLNYIRRKKLELNENETNLKTWQNSYQDFNVKLNNLNNNLKIIEAKSSYDFKSNLDDLIESLDKLAAFEADLSSVDSNTLIRLEDEFKSLNEKIRKDYDDMDNENSKELSDIYEALVNLNQKRELEAELETLEKQYHISKITYELFKDKKQNALKKIIEEIEELVNSYYNFIHNDDEFNSPEIHVPKSTGITLDLNFNDITADPRSYSSEGHLDSLGLCIFLAFAKKFNSYNFLILDDIIATVDLSHKERIAMLILSEFRDYQFIITTHSQLWFRQLKNYIQNYNMSGNYIFSEIRTPDSHTGPVLTKNLPAKELIEKYIELGDTFAAGNAIRRYLENVLEKICRTNSIPLALKQYYMVDDYFKPVKRYFMTSNLLSKNPEIRQYYKNVFDELDNSRYMGNLLSHNDDNNLDVSINEVIKFKDAVYSFEKAMTCTKHKTRVLHFDEKHNYAFCSHENCMEKISFKK